MTCRQHERENLQEFLNSSRYSELDFEGPNYETVIQWFTSVSLAYHVTNI